MTRFVQFALLFVLAAFALSCVKAAPAASPYLLSERPTRSWLTVEENKRIVSCAELAGPLSEGILRNEPPSSLLDAEFSPEFLKTELSEDGIPVVRKVKRPFVRPLRGILNALLRDEGYSALSWWGFRQAIRRGQLTCHFAARQTLGEKPTPHDKYAGVAGRECVNNLLFSTSPPSDARNISASIGVNGVSEGRDAGYTPSVLGEADDFACLGEEVSLSWVTDWATLIPVLRGVTVPGKSICIGNLPPGATEDLRFANAATEALIEFERAIGGLDVFFAQVRWDDPCLPAALEPFLADKNITLLGGEGLAITEGCKARWMIRNLDVEALEAMETVIE